MVWTTVASAILNLENEVSKNPKNAAAWTDLANLYYDTDKADKAIKAYTKSLELAPNNPDVLTDMGVMFNIKDEGLGEALPRQGLG